jgi:transcriptional regulator with XRE-family HTH domain
MKSNELRFRHVGLSSDGAVIFCAMDNGKTYELPLSALEKAEDWDPRAKPKSVGIIHDGYAAIVEFNTGVKIDFPSDFVLHVCEPSYSYYRKKGRAASGVGARIREIRGYRGLTLDALTARCGIAKPNLSRLENDKVTPTFETLRTIAKALDIHPVLLVSKNAWTWTRHTFGQWELALRWDAVSGHPAVPVHSADLVKVFLVRWPEHAYAHGKLLEECDYAQQHPLLLDGEEWERQKAAADSARNRAKPGNRKRPVAAD